MLVNFAGLLTAGAHYGKARAALGQALAVTNYTMRSSSLPFTRREAPEE